MNKGFEIPGVYYFQKELYIMVAILALCIPPLILVCVRNRILGIHQTQREQLVHYLIVLIALNWLMIMILFYGFQNSGNLLSKLNTNITFACKYIALSMFISVVEPVVEKFIRKHTKCTAGIIQRSDRRTATKENVHVSTIFIYGLFLVFMILTISNKENFNVDEIYSYGLANHQGGIDISFEDSKTYNSSVEPYLEYLTVNKSHRFDYENVWKNQINDVHPPLYYVILHTICSIFAGTFSKWYAGSINIIFALLTLLVLRKLIRKFTACDEKTCSIVSVVFILSSGILSTVSFFRMYIIAMFWVTLLTYMLVKEIGEWKFDLSYFVKLFSIALLGALTHYYCIMYTVFICAVFCAVLIVRKKWFPVGGFIVTGCLAGGTAYMLFPAMIKHMFFGYRGTQALDNLQQSPYEFWTRIKQFFNIVDKEVFGNTLCYIAAGVVFAMIIYCILEKQDSFRKLLVRLLTALHADCETAKIIAIRYVIVCVSIVIYFLFVSKAAAYISERYMFPVYGVAFVGLTSFVIMIARNVFQEKTAFLVIVIMMSMIVVNEWKNIGWSYLYKSSISLLEESEKYRDVDCLYIYDYKWKTEPSFMEIQSYKSITFVQAENIAEISSLDITDQNQLMIMIIGDKEDTLKKIMEIYSQLTTYKEIGSFGYATTYYVYSE